MSLIRFLSELFHFGMNVSSVQDKKNSMWINGETKITYKTGASMDSCTFPRSRLNSVDFESSMLT
jgi:hypothetical protein